MNDIAMSSEPSPRARLSLKQVHVRWLVTLAVASGAIVVFFPFFWMAVTSLKTAPEIQRVPLQIAPDRWLELMGRDKKVAAGTIRYILLDAIGAAVVRADVGDEALREFLH